MGKINWQRVIQGGLLAGAVANLLQFTANSLFLRGEWRTALESLGLRVAASGHNRFPLVVLNLAGGIFAVWLYAMIWPRYGLGPKTAAKAGLVFWLLSALLPVAMWSLSGGLPAVPAGLLATHLETYLVIAVMETMAGAWTYREQRA